MGALIEPTLTELVECAGQREYFITDVHSETVCLGLVRHFCGVKRGNLFEVRYTVVMPAVCVPAAARACTDAAERAGIIVGLTH